MINWLRRSGVMVFLGYLCADATITNNSISVGNVILLFVYLVISVVAIIAHDDYMAEEFKNERT